MIKNFGYKVLTLVLALALITIIIASWSSRSYTPMYFATSTLDFGSTSPGMSTSLTISVTGAALSDAVVLGVPNASVVTTGNFWAYVSSSNTVTVRYTNTDGINTYDPSSGSFKIIIIKH